MKLPVSVLAAAETAFNRYLSMDPGTARAMGELRGRVLAIELRDWDLRIYVIPTAERVRFLGEYEGEPDTCLRGTPIGLLRLGLSDDSAGELFARNVEITGDTELGQRFKQILDRVDIDWEEQWSHVVGDVRAHQSARAARGTAAWLQGSLDSLSRNFTDYLQEESRALPHPVEVERFLGDVDALRSDADRLQARVKRLQVALSAQAARGEER